MIATLRTASHQHMRPVVRPVPGPTASGSGLGLW